MDLERHNSNIRRGLETELWSLTKNSKGYACGDIRDSDDLSRLNPFSKCLLDLGGDFEFSRNLIELRTSEEYGKDARDIEKELIRQISLLKKIDQNKIIIGTGCYPGPDEPRIDLTESAGEKSGNMFWLEFGLAFPDLFTTRFIASSQMNVSVRDWKEKEIVEIYNVLAGISPVLISSFSTSPSLMGLNTDYWNKRQHIVSLRDKVRSNLLMENTYPLKDLEHYRQAVDSNISRMRRVLVEKNPGFFRRDDVDPIAILRSYRGSAWGVEKLVTDQVLRINYRSNRISDLFIEVRCIDTQESPKSTAALSRLGEHIVESRKELENIIPKDDMELRDNLNQAIKYGPNGKLSVRGKPILMQDYSKSISEILFGRSPRDRYCEMLANRFERPPAYAIRGYIEKGGDLIEKLEKCMVNNLTLEESI